MLQVKGIWIRKFKKKIMKTSIDTQQEGKRERANFMEIGDKI